MTNSNPLLSLVVTSRNDDHGGNALYRMQLFISGFLEQASRYSIDSELIIVEWNPLPDRPKLAQALKWPHTAGPCAVRIIEVPLSIHKRFEYSDRLPLFQMIGKNVGIRRARGRFILATNIDILFSNEMAQFFTSGQMMSGRLYRVDRYDVPSDVPESFSIDEQLAYCRKNIIRINGRGRTRVLGESNFSLRRLVEVLGYPVRRVKRLRKSLGPSLHTNACGDFTLMACEHWFAVCGYPEFEMYSFWLDSLLCYAAHFDGVCETMLEDPMRIYHIEHLPGSGWSPGLGGKILKKRLAATGIPQLSTRQYMALVKDMCRKGHPLIFNESKSWGLANESLLETVVTAGGCR